MSRRPRWDISVWAVGLVLGLTAVALGSSLLRYGATDDWVRFRFFLLLAPALLLALWSALLVPRLRAAFATEGRPWGHWLFAGIGVVVLVAAVALPTVRAEGFVHFAVAWMGLGLGFWLVAAGRRWALALVIMLAAFGLLEALLGIVQSVAGIELIGGRRLADGVQATGTFINRNHFAGLLNMCMSLALGLLTGALAMHVPMTPSGSSGGHPLRRSERFAAAWMSILILSLFGLAIIFSRSRGGTLVFVATVLFVAVLLVAARRGGASGASVAFPLVLVVVVVLVGAAFGLEALTERFERTQEDSVGRAQIYRDTLGLIADHPAIGVGPGMFRWRIRPYQTGGLEALYAKTHNDYLQTAAEWGVPLAIGFWLWLLAVFYRGVRTALSPRRRAWQRSIALGGTAAMLSIFVHSLFDFNLQIPANAFVFMVVVGAVAAVSRPEASATGSHPGRALVPGAMPRARSRAMLWVTLWALLLSVGLLAASWRTTVRMRSALALRGATSLEDLERATDIDPTNGEAWRRQGGLLSDHTGLRDPEAALARLDRAIAVNPWSWRYHIDRAALLESTGDLGGARRAWEQVLVMNPRSGNDHWGYANFLLRQGHTAEAFDEMGHAVEVDGQLASPAFDLVLKGGGDWADLDRIWPRAPEARMGLVDRAVRRSAVAPADFLLRQLEYVAAGSPELARIGFAVEHLARRGEATAAHEAWGLLTSAVGLEDPDYRSGDNLFWNGDFRLEPAGTGLGWRLDERVKSVRYRLDALGAVGERSLEIQFQGKENVAFRHVWQLLVLPRGGPHRFSARVRSEGLSTDEGVYLELLGGEDRLLWRSQPLLGGTDWLTLEALVTIDAGDRVATLSIRRDHSGRIDSRISGSFFLDSVRLQSVPEATASIPTSSSQPRASPQTRPSQH